MARSHGQAASAGVHISAGGRSQSHHHVARVSWRLEAGPGGDLLAASDLLVFDALGRIQFDDRTQQRASTCSVGLLDSRPSGTNPLAGALAAGPVSATS